MKNKNIKNCFLFIALFLFFLIVCLNFNKTVSGKDDLDNFLNRPDAVEKCVGLYICPETDCPECIETGIRVLNMLPDNENRIILCTAKQQSFDDYFQNELLTSNADMRLKQKFGKLDIPHPSIFISNNSFVYFYLYISADQYERAKMFELVQVLLNELLFPNN